MVRLFCLGSLPVLISGAADTAIPTAEGGANHTPEFTKSAATSEAHHATLQVAKGLSAVGFRVLADNDFFAEVCRIDHRARVPHLTRSFSGAEDV